MWVSAYVCDVRCVVRAVVLVSCASLCVLCVLGETRFMCVLSNYGL